MPRAPRRDHRDRSGRFKVTAKAFFLTYPQARGVTLERIFEYFTDHWRHQPSGTRPQDVLVAKEDHEDGEPHFHAFIRFPARIDILNSNAFDYKEGPNEFHPNIQSVRSPKHVITYCTKEGDFKSTFTVKIKKTVKQILEESEDVMDFLQRAIDEQGWANARAYNALKKLAEDYFGKKNAVSQVCEPIFDITTFQSVPDPIKEFVCSLRGRQPGGRDRVKSLWIWGATRLGKTALAQSLGKHTRIANVWNFECLDRSGQSEYLILDDLSWDSWKYQYKSILGCQRDVTFTGKYKKPTSFRFGIPAIVLTNELPLLTPDEVQWMNGNVVFVEITEKLYVPNSL